MLVRSVKDVIEILGFKIEDAYEQSIKEMNCDDIKVCVSGITRREAVLNGISQILPLLSSTSSSLFPRKIMTKRTNGQIIVNSRQEMSYYFENSNFLDCRVNAYPCYEGKNTVNQMRPGFIFIDLDLQTRTLQELEICLSGTLGNIRTVLGGYPAVLWTGNGYHVYQPTEALNLEKLEEFKQFQKPSLKFLRFAEQYLTSGKSDPFHSPSFKSCMLRIPGSLNSKCKEEVRLIQKWDRYRPHISSLLERFHVHLVSEMMSGMNFEKRNQDGYSPDINQRSRTIWWIEKLLSNPIDDYRKNATSLIIAPYLLNIKKLTWNEAYNTISQWLGKCNSLRRLGFNAHYYVNNALNNSMNSRFKPMRFNILKDRNKILYDGLSVPNATPQDQISIKQRKEDMK